MIFRKNTFGVVPDPLAFYLEGRMRFYIAVWVVVLIATHSQWYQEPRINVEDSREYLGLRQGSIRGLGLLKCQHACQHSRKKSDF